MAEFKLGRLRFVWKGAWAQSTTYYIDDIINYGGKTFLCVEGHTASDDFYTDLDNVPTRWNQFSDGQDWKGNWAGSTLYKVNDIVKYGGYLYIANEGHTSQSLLEDDQAKWDLFAESLNWLGNWATDTTYKVNDVVKYGGLNYIANTGHTSASSETLGLEDDQASWDLFSEGLDWKGDWATGTRYKINDMVRYGGTTYLCTAGHTSASTETLGLEDDQGNWDYFHRGVEYKGEWATDTRYKDNDLVKYGAGIWICTTDHTSSSSFNDSNFALFSEGIQYELVYDNATTYQPGDIVKYGGYSYIAKTVNTGQNPYSSSSDWDVFLESFSFVGDWDGATAYKVGEVVRHGSYTYYAQQDGTGYPPDDNEGTYWVRLNSGFRWRGEWDNETQYLIGDAVKFGPNSYVCILKHTSDDDDSTQTQTNNSPEKDLTGTYWNLLTAGLEESVLNTDGDIVFFSGAGPARLPIGEDGQVLAVENGQPAWKTWGNTKKVYYVALHGTDSPAPLFGSSIDKPFKTIRYAAEQIEKGIENPNAKYLLERNRTFIQKEIVEWTDYQITNDIAPFTSSFTYDKDKCQRDMGLLLDGIIFDISHGTNKESRAVAQSYFSELGASYVSGQEDETVASINYGVTLIEKALTNLAPDTNYQTENGISLGDRIKQYIDFSYTAETDANATAAALAGITTDAITAGDIDDIPALAKANYTIFVKTGLFEEVLPIILPAETAIVGDELRSTRVSPAGKITADNDKAKSVAAITHLKGITEDIITNVAVTPTTGNTATQDTSSQIAGNTGSSTAVTRVENNADEIIDILTNGTDAADAFTFTTPTNYGSSLTDTAYASTSNATGDTTGFDNALAQIVANKTFIQAEITAWIEEQIANETAPFTADFTYDSVACERDVGLIIDALRYDVNYGGNYQTRVAADAYYSYGVATFGSGEKEETLASYERLKTVIGQVILETAVTTSPNNGESQDTSGTAGSAASAEFAEERIQDIIDTITNDGTLPTLVEPATSWVATDLVTARTELNSAKSTIQTDAVQYIKREYPTLLFNESTCSRDVGYIVDALGYDLMLNTNFASIKAGLAYRRGISSALTVIADQLDATSDTISFIKKKATYIVASGAVVAAQELWDEIIGYVNTGTRPIVVGTNTPTEDLDRINGANILLLNKEFFASEATAYINDTYTDTVTSASSINDRFTSSDTSWMVAGDSIRFSGTVFGGIETDTTYFVKEVVSGTEFTISETLDGDVLELSGSSGSMTVSYYYLEARCENDVMNYIEAIAYDIIYTGNYKSVYAGRYYRNALTGSKLEDMYYVRNGGGLRNQTVLGLDGSSDGNTTGVQSALTDENNYGTQRPRAGAYASLDPGWGPNDDHAWVTNKSTYIQNVTTFGIGAVGQKIDGSLHNGGNDSIVSNDFTQVISDGIGAWITNLGRAELVSVFSYYAHIGYLAENGGQIRATNGNCSYGDFGAVSEGVDITETEILGEINNRGNDANVANVITDSDKILISEYANAGQNYTNATFTVSGGGSSADLVGDETRNGAVFQVRLTDPGDSSGTGGEGYVFASNAAQGGTLEGTITLAATDTKSSAAYVGMSIYIVTGEGAGQYGFINSYNSGSKVATVFKESDGTQGWDHLIPGTAIVDLGITSQYEITPRITFTAPPYSKTTRQLTGNFNWQSISYGEAHGTYNSTSPSSTSGSGTLATFNITRVNGEYTVETNATGTLFEVDDTVTFLGSVLGGEDSVNDLVLTITEVTESGAITAFTSAGDAIPARWVAVGGVGDSSLDTAATSTDGITWEIAGMPSSEQWSAVTYGQVNGTGYWVAVARQSIATAYSVDGVNWTASTLGEAADWVDIAAGNNLFVAIAESDSSSTLRAVTANFGQTWNTGTLPSGAKAIEFGLGKFVVVEGNFSNAAAYSANGVSWTATTLPANDDSAESNWQDLAFGNSTFVAIADNDGSIAVSADGETWIDQDLKLPNAQTAEWKKIAYGNGVFLALADGEIAATSEDGFIWTERNATVKEIDILETSNDEVVDWDSGTLSASANWYGLAYGNEYIAVGDNSGSPIINSSADGKTWSAETVSVSPGAEIRSIAWTGTQYVAPLYASRNVLTSPDGSTWTENSTALTILRFWADTAAGNGWIVTIDGSGTSTANRSQNGTSWSAATLPSLASWSRVEQGNAGGTEYFVVIAKDNGSGTATDIAGYSDDNGATWTSATLPSSDFWNGLTYGNGTFVAVAGDASNTSNAAAYSTDGGQNWSSATLPATANWTNVSYNGSVFVATAYNSTTAAISEDGITWVSDTMSTTDNWWQSIGNVADNEFVIVPLGGSNTDVLGFEANTNRLSTHSTSELSIGDILTIPEDSAGVDLFGGLPTDTRLFIESIPNSTQFTVSLTPGGLAETVTDGTGSMFATIGKSWSAVAYGGPYTNYGFMALSSGGVNALQINAGARTRGRALVSDEAIAQIKIHEPGSNYTTAPTMTITDPSNIGADASHEVRIANGVLGQPSYENRGSDYETAAITITGDGFADNFQVGTFIDVKDLTAVPLEGSNMRIASIDDIFYRVVSVRNLVGTSAPYTATIQVSPEINVAEAPSHEETTRFRRRYSQVRLTGHDFLDIGTGNETQTNYPGLPLQDPVPANETVDSGGGRVFFTSTDQDGNFRVGGLFNVEQSTGVATLNADAFNIAGLNELSLGSVALGGTGAVISEFSTDPFFTADSDSVIPTQRAIKAYITSQIGGGGSSLNVNTLTAGVVFIAGQEITTTTTQQIFINTKMNFVGGIDGDAVSLNYFLLGG